MRRTIRCRGPRGRLRAVTGCSARVLSLTTSCLIWSLVSLPVSARTGSTISVADMIRFATIGDPEQGPEGLGYLTVQEMENHRSEFSPDGKKVAVIVFRPDLRTNSVRGDVLVFKTAELLTHPSAKRVARFVSTSNRPPVYQLRWLADDRTLTAVGEYAGGVPQVYRIDTKIGTVVALTRAPRGVVAYATTPDGARVAFMAPASPDLALERYRERHGYAITGGNLWDAISGNITDSVHRQRLQLFVRDASGGAASEISRPREVRPLGGAAGTEVRIGRCRDYLAGVSLSPDGRFAVLTCTISSAPRRWDIYASPANGIMARGLHKAAPADWRNQDVVFDLEKHIAFMAWDAPLPSSAWGRPMTWLPGGHWAVFANLALPLESSGRERDHAGRVGVAALNLATGRHVLVYEGGPVTYIRWDGRANCLSIQVERVAGDPDSTAGSNQAVCYRKYATGWGPAIHAHPIDPNGNGSISLTVREALNSPPLLVARDARTGIRHAVLDPNPWIHDKRLGLVRPVTWKSASGKLWRGGIYYPPDFVRGRRYPLVIQTHGFSPERFSLYGSRSSAYAAQPLAAHDILVLQVDDLLKEAVTDPLHEGAAADAEYEGAINYLNRSGLIDPNRIGLVGWSHSCFLVRYFLTHSHYKVAAAVTSDGYDAGYVQFIAFPWIRPWVVSNIGVGPWDDRGGAWVYQWFNRSPDFRLEQVDAPVRVEALEGGSSLIAQWEFYAGLRELRRPVDLYYQPDGAHEAVLPLYRLGTAAGTVQWFRFWLQGYEDPDPTKVGQYRRWERLCDMQKAEHPDRPTFCVPTKH